MSWDMLPIELKLKIYNINKYREKEELEQQLEKEKNLGIVRFGNKGKKQTIIRTTRGGNEYKQVRYINCKECGKDLFYNGGGYYDQTVYECCSECYTKFREERKEFQKVLDEECLLD